MKLLVIKAFKSPFALLAVCLVLYLAAHSFFVGIFVAFVVLAWIKRSVLTKQKNEAASSDPRTAAPSVVPSQPKAVAESQTPVVMPIRRQYAKSAVVLPVKTGIDD